MSRSESATLFRLAAQLDDHAAAVRGRARRLGLASSQLRWHSFAADLFRSRAAGSAAMSHRSATALEHAAAALRRHARTVSRIEEIADTVERTGEQIAHGAARAGRYLTSWL